MGSVDVKIENLCFSYNDGIQVLNNINLNFQQKKFYSILGPNGSGKTTLLKAIARLHEPSSGCISIGNIDIKTMKSKTIARLIAVVPQYTSIEFDFSVYDIVMMGRAPYITRFSDALNSDKEAVKKAMEGTNTWEFKDKSINALSGGERQRVIVARAIAQETGIILLDEPISHLDIHHQIDILNNIRVMNREAGRTIIAVLHDLNIAAAYSDNIILMHEGKIHSVGTPEEVLTCEAIQEIYGLKVHIINDTDNNRPYIVPEYFK